MFTSQILQSADQAYGVSHPAVEGNVTAVAGNVTAVAGNVTAAAGRAHAWVCYFEAKKTTQPTESCSPAEVAPRRWHGGG